MNGDEQKEHAMLYNGTEEFEEFEEGYEDEEGSEYDGIDITSMIVPFKISGKDKTAEITLEKNESMHITNVALAADNDSKEKHIIEICSGYELSNKIVIARLIPDIIESQCVDIFIPEHPTKQQTIVFVLTGKGNLGDVDVIAKIDLEEQESSSDHHDHESCDCSHHHHNDASSEEDDNDIIQTLQQQKDEIQSKKQQKQQNNKKESMNPFDIQFKEEKQENQQQIQKPQWRNVKGVRILDKKVGHGPEAKRGDKVVVKYIGRLNNETGREFDRSEKNFRFQLGQGGVIPGWDIGVCNMKVGGKRWLIIPPHLAYGKQDVPGIPKNSTLFFEVELVDVKK